MTRTKLTRADRAGILDAYGDRYGLRTLVETGLYDGKGTGMLASFDRYIAIDLSASNVARAQAAGHDARCGDSGELLPAVLDELDAPAVILLDAHGIDCHGGTVGRFPGWDRLPLLQELRAVAAWEHGATSVVIVDDMPEIGEWVDCGLALLGNAETFETFLNDLPVRWLNETRDGMMRLVP